jgi:hypothetical protein
MNIDPVAQPPEASGDTRTGIKIEDFGRFGTRYEQWQNYKLVRLTIDRKNYS